MIFELPYIERERNAGTYYEAVSTWIGNRYKRDAIDKDDMGCAFLKSHNMLVSKHIDTGLREDFARVGLTKDIWEQCHFVNSMHNKTIGYTIVLLTYSKWVGRSGRKMLLNIEDEYIALELKLIASTL